MEMTYNPAEVYVTEVEQEAYDLSGQLTLAQVRNHTEANTDKYGKPYYVVVIESPLEARDRAVAVRRRMFGS
jgi:hypothetical protein